MPKLMRNSLFPGELKHSIDEALAGGSGDTVEQRIHKLLRENPVILFMKGHQLLSLVACLLARPSRKCIIHSMTSS